MINNIIEFSALNKKIVRSKKPDVYCRCAQLTIDEHERTLYCPNCNKHFDAFDRLLKMAKERDFAEFRVSDLAKQEKQLTENIKKLKQEERNIKSRIKRAMIRND